MKTWFAIQWLSYGLYHIIITFILSSPCCRLYQEKILHTTISSFTMVLLPVVLLLIFQTVHAKLAIKRKHLLLPPYVRKLFYSIITDYRMTGFSCFFMTWYMHRQTVLLFCLGRHNKRKIVFFIWFTFLKLDNIAQMLNFYVVRVFQELCW